MDSVSKKSLYLWSICELRVYCLNISQTHEIAEIQDVFYDFTSNNFI